MQWGDLTSSTWVIEWVILGTEEMQQLQNLAKVQGTSGFSRFPTTLHIQLSVDALHLRFHGIDRNNQFLSNLRVGTTCSEQAQHALLLGAERLLELC